jgi:antitoxin component YwqK of YwqJK toxin-antitoxin module
MRTAIVLALAFVFGGGCRRDGAEHSEKVAAKIQLYAVDSDSPKREIPLQNAEEIGQLSKFTGDFTGRFVLTINSTLQDGTISQVLEGYLQEGKIDGNVRTFTFIDGKRSLIAQMGYRADERQGLSESYYLTTGTIQFRANYESGYKDGLFAVFYPDGKIALRSHYSGGKLDGQCEAFDNSGAKIASGLFSQNEMNEGQFLANLDDFIAGCVAGKPFEVRIVSIDADGKLVESGEATINAK